MSIDPRDDGWSGTAKPTNFGTVEFFGDPINPINSNAHRRADFAVQLMARMIQPVENYWAWSEDQWCDYFCERASLAVQAADHLIYHLDNPEHDD